MSIAIASILQESNTFSPVKTRYEDFSPVFGASARERHEGKKTEMGGFLDVLKRDRRDIAPVCAAWAITANRLLKADLRRLLDDFSTSLAAAGSPEGLLLAMHGAQTAEGCDDVEGAVLARARAILGPGVPIVLTLDLHANVTQAMVSAATAIVGYQTYPHIDLYETGERGARLLLRILGGKVRPVIEWRKIPMIVPAENMQTTHGPMHRLFAAGAALEAGGAAESVSIFGVQPWMDIHEMGCSVVLCGNNNRATLGKEAAKLARAFWNARREFDATLTPVPEAIAGARKLKRGPAIFAESSDSTGSGSPGDSTGVLKHLIADCQDLDCAIFLVDPETVAAAHEAGAGATITRKIGGCFDKKLSKPVLVTARVRMLSDGRWTPRARGYNTGIESSMGRAAVLECGGVRILTAERAAMTVDPALFRSHGIEPLDCRIVVVKSPAGFRAAYAPLAKAIYVVDTPGVSTANFPSLPYRRIPRPLYPFDREMPDPDFA